MGINFKGFRQRKQALYNLVEGADDTGEFIGPSPGTGLYVISARNGLYGGCVLVACDRVGGDYALNPLATSSGSLSSQFASQPDRFAFEMEDSGINTYPFIIYVDADGWVRARAQIIGGASGDRTVDITVNRLTP